MKKKTPFYIAAERFANYTNRTEGACTELHGGLFVLIGTHVGELIHRHFFHKLFTPDLFERAEFNVHNPTSIMADYWMTSYTRTPDENRNDRVIALLLADQLWQDEQKKRRKNERD